MARRPCSIPVGILVSVSGASGRRRPRSRGDDPPIKDDPLVKKEASPRPGVAVGVSLGSVLALLLIASGLLAAKSPSAHDAERGRQAGSVLPGDQRAADQRAALVKQAVAQPPAPSEALTAGPVEPATARPIAAFFERLAKLQAPAPAPPEPAPATVVELAAPACSNLGTAVTFFEHPPDAFRRAARENKLVLVVHLSGNFEDQAFT
jgi:hypothetical protein